MRNKSYETMILLKPELDEAGREAVIKFIKDLAQKEGFEIISVDDLGRKTLAYKIAKIGEAHYYLLTFDATPAFVAELDRNLRLNDKVLRFLTVLRLSHPATTIKSDEKIKAERSEPAVTSQADQTDKAGSIEDIETQNQIDEEEVGEES